MSGTELELARPIHPPLARIVLVDPGEQLIRLDVASFGGMKKQDLGGAKTRAATHMVARFAGMGLAEITIRKIERRVPSVSEPLG